MTIDCPFCTNAKNIGERVLAFDVHTGMLATDLGNCKFTHHEAVVFNSLKHGRPVHQDKIMEDLYGHDAYNKDVNILCVFLTKINQRLRSLGIQIISYGYGTCTYYLSDNIEKQRRRPAPNTTEVLELVSKNGNVTATLIQKLAPHISLKSIQLSLLSLERQGCVERIAKGLYRVKP